MKANELMTGDWVLYGGKDLRRVAGLPGNGTVRLEAEDSLLVLEDTLGPASLTPGFFERNGLVDTLPMCKSLYPERTGYWTLKEGSMVMRVWTEGEESKKYVLSFGWIDSISTVVAGCRYVHEFQHALKLARIEKEVTL